MTPKQYLNQAFRLEERISSRLRELQHLRVIEQNVQGVDLTNIRVQGSSCRSAVESIAFRIIGMETIINSEIEQLLELKDEIRTAIAEVEDERLQLLLRLRYIEYMRWSEIACIIRYEKTQLFELHKVALKKIERNLKCGVKRSKTELPNVL